MKNEDLDIRAKCEVIANNFQWWSSAANKYLLEDRWTQGRIQFVETRYDVYERVQKGHQKHPWKLEIPINVRQGSYPHEWRVKLSVQLQGYKCIEYVHILSPTNTNSLMLYRTKVKSNAFDQGDTLKGHVWLRNSKVLFAGYNFPVATKVNLSSVEGV